MALCSQPRAPWLSPSGAANFPCSPLGRLTTQRFSSTIPASRLLHHAVPSQSPWGSTEPLVTFLTFFMFSITPDVVTLNEGEKKTIGKISVLK